MKTKKWLLLCMFVPLLLSAQKDKNVSLNIVYIGNSITQGVLLANPAQDAPPAQTSLWLRQQKGIDAVEYFNLGFSGHTTVDFLPASQTDLPKVKQAAEKLVKQNPQSILLFSVMLGTNDSAVKGPNGSPISAPQYYTNMKAIIDELLGLHPKALFVLHRPIWYSPNTYNGAMYLLEGLKRLESYYPQLQNLVSYYAAKYPNQVLLGDADAFDYFKTQYQSEFVPENGNAGTFYLHPNQKGAAHLAEFWGKAIYKVVVPGN